MHDGILCFTMEEGEPGTIWGYIREDDEKYLETYVALHDVDEQPAPVPIIPEELKLPRRLITFIAPSSLVCIERRPFVFRWTPQACC